MDNKLKNKNILLIGFSGDLGSEFLKYLHENKANLILADLKNKKFHIFKKKYQDSYFYICNVLKEKNIVDLKKNILKKVTHLDAIIYNVGFTSKFSKNKNNRFPEFYNYSLKDWNLSINTNLTGAFLISKYLIGLLKKKRGSLIFISSIYGVVAPDPSIYKSQKFKTLAGYSASKAGLIGLSRWLATNFASDGIRVNTIIPGGIKSTQNKKFVRNYSKRVPMKRMAKKNEINGILSYLISDDSSYATGQEFIVDGGLTSW